MPAPTLPIGFNFRSTVGFVTDTSPEVFIDVSVTYSATPGYGWSVNPSGALDERDRSAGVDRRLAGMQFFGNATSGTPTFRVDLASAGTYRIRLALGDQSGSQNIYAYIYDNTTLKTTVAAGVTTSAGNRWLDATGVERNQTTWPSSNASIDVVFASTILNFKMGGNGTGGQSSAIAHMYLELVSGGGGSGTGGAAYHYRHRLRG